MEHAGQVHNESSGLERTAPYVSSSTQLLGGGIDSVSPAMNANAPAGYGSLWDAGVWESNQGSNVERW